MVEIIYKETVSMGKPYPVYRHYNDSVQLIIYNSTEDIDFVKFIIKEQESKQIAFSLAELMILRFVKDNRSIIFRKSVELTQVTEDEARRTIEKSKKEDIIQNDRTGRYANYKLVKK